MARPAGFEPATPGLGTRTRARRLEKTARDRRRQPTVTLRVTSHRKRASDCGEATAKDRERPQAGQKHATDLYERGRRIGRRGVDAHECAEDASGQAAYTSPAGKRRLKLNPTSCGVPSLTGPNLGVPSGRGYRSLGERPGAAQVGDVEPRSSQRATVFPICAQEPRRQH